VNDVAITGIGVVSAFGVGTERFWNGLLSGHSPLVADESGVPTGAVEGLDVGGVVRTPAGRRIDHASLLALTAARLALADARIAETALDPTRTGLGLGSSLGNLRETAPFMDRVFDRGAGNPLVFPNMVMNAPLSYLSIELGITGPSVMVTEGEVSGEAAIAWGARFVADGGADVCLVGATDELADVMVPVLGKAGGLTRGTARPLDRASDGRALGEGSAVLVLEAGARARARGARIYAEIESHRAFGVPASVHGHPRDPDVIARVLRPLLAEAELVVAAANGMPAFDAVEAQLLASVVGARVPVTAPRGAIGEFGSAGALAVAVAALALHDGRVPPTVGCRLPAREDLDVVVDTARPCRPAVAVVNGMGRGGVCRPIRLVRTRALGTA
jgi:3-oxoacyl-[acyl-carrier-protein] synthase II